MNLRNGLVGGIIAILAVAAAVGWTRGRSPQTNAYSTPIPPAADAVTYTAPGYSSPEPEPYAQLIHRPVVIRPPEPVYAPAPAYYAPRPVYRETRRHHHRSTEKSVAIVAGSAGVGAAVGALAGGGKGAGIGALAGGAGGFVYDRLTHNH